MKYAIFTITAVLTVSTSMKSQVRRFPQIPSNAQIILGGDVGLIEQNNPVAGLESHFRTLSDLIKHDDVIKIFALLNYTSMESEAHLAGIGSLVKQSSSITSLADVKKKYPLRNFSVNPEKHDECYFYSAWELRGRGVVHFMCFPDVVRVCYKGQDGFIIQ